MMLCQENVHFIFTVISRCNNFKAIIQNASLFRGGCLIDHHGIMLLDREDRKQDAAFSSSIYSNSYWSKTATSYSKTEFDFTMLANDHLSHCTQSVDSQQRLEVTSVWTKVSSLSSIMKALRVSLAQRSGRKC